MIVSKENIILIILIIFQTVGIIGISIPELRELTVMLTPMNLLLTSGLFIWGLNQKSVKFFLAILIAFLLGYFIEVIGVATGVLFGEYQYGAPLGWKIFDVPLTIGINWFVLSFSSLGIVNKLTKSFYLRVLLSSILMVILDIIIEPVAIALDFWTWAGEVVPIQNYIMWFMAAIVINTIVSVLVKEFKFKTSLHVFCVQVYFFLMLNILL